MQIDVDVVKIKKFWDYLDSTKKRINVLYGGAGSGKSYQLALFMLFKKFIAERNKSILIVRKTMPSLRISAYKLILSLISQYSLDRYLPIDHHKTSATLRFRDNEINFMGLDDPEKIKSAEWNYIWAEEATDLSLMDYQQLNLRLRRQTDGINQMFLSLNPIDAFHWINTELLEKPNEDLSSLHSTYKDNKFLPDEYTRELEKLKEQDFTLYQIYAQGVWGVLQNLIYSNYDVLTRFPDAFDEIIYGYDFGFTNPSAVVEIGIRDGDYYLQEQLYEAGLTSSAFVDRLGALGINKDACQYGDSNRADYIDEIYSAGYNVRGAEKGAGSVINGIDTVKKYKIHIHADSANLLKEIRGYKFKEDRLGRVIDEPVKFNDHLMDAMRYAITEHTFPQAISGLR